MDSSPLCSDPLGSVHLPVVARVSSCFKEKFGTPRQPGLVPEARGRLVFEPEYSQAEMVRGLEGFSHLWVLFYFHQSAAQGWSPTVRPPRFGGNERLGVWATRSPFRPSPVGLSVVELESIEWDKGRLILNVKGLDLVEGTPVLDVKPYVAYSDSVPEACSAYAQIPSFCEVEIPEACAQGLPEDVLLLISQTLSTDPRPAYHLEGKKDYKLALEEYTITWSKEQSRILVKAIERR